MLLKKFSLAALVYLSVNFSLHAMQLQQPLREMDYALISAAKNNDIRGVNKQLQLGANINARSSTTALIEACSLNANNETLVAVLLENEANPNLANGELAAPLHFAAEKGNVGVLELLEKAGADLTVQDTAGNTAYHRALIRNQGSSISWLHSKGVDIDRVNHAGLAPIHAAILETSLGGISYVLKENARLDVKTKASGHPNAQPGPLPVGSTVFHASTAVEHYGIYKSLIQESLVAYALFNERSSTALYPYSLFTLLLCLKRVCPLVYGIRKDVLLPNLSKNFNAQTVTCFLTSTEKQSFDLGCKVLKQRAEYLQRVLAEQDAAGETALAKENARNVLNNIQPSEVLTDPALYDLHFRPFVAAVKTKTVDQLPDTNVFKIAYIKAMPRKVEEAKVQNSDRVWKMFAARSPLGRLINNLS